MGRVQDKWKILHSIEGMDLLIYSYFPSICVLYSKILRASSCAVLYGAVILCKIKAATVFGARRRSCSARTVSAARLSPDQGAHRLWLALNF